MTERTRYYFGNTTHARPVGEPEALAMIAQSNVAESYTDPAGIRINRPDTEVHEVYALDETPGDYPDGDPYAATLTVLPEGWYWDDDSPERDDETVEGCRLILIITKANWPFEDEDYSIEDAICECLNTENAHIDDAGDLSIGSPLSSRWVDDARLIRLVSWLRQRDFVA